MVQLGLKTLKEEKPDATGQAMAFDASGELRLWWQRIDFVSRHDLYDRFC